MMKTLFVLKMSVMSLGASQKVVTGRHENNALLMWGGETRKRCTLLHYNTTDIIILTEDH
jgi:hypothetical protein